MGFLDSSQSIVAAILTRKGRELLAKNDGSFKIVKFAFGDDEINYQLYDPDTEDDTHVLNLPILEPSSNELTALRYRLVTAPVGTQQVAYLVANPTSLLLQNITISNSTLANKGTFSIITKAGVDTSYNAYSRDIKIAKVDNPIIQATVDSNGQASAVVAISAGFTNGTTYIDIIGKDTGAIISVPITITTQQ
jgi:hypothetical protein